MSRAHRDRLRKLEAGRARRAVVVLWPDGARDGWGRPAKTEAAGVVIPMPRRAMTPEEVEAARGSA